MSDKTPIPDTMRAVRLRGKGPENIRVEEVPVPRPNDDQVLVRVDAAGVCTSLLKLVAQGSDHTLINGWDLEEHPTIMGDEGCVTVIAAGRNVAGRYPLGKRYATQPAVDCPPINHRERYTGSGEGMTKVAVGYTLPGHLAEYMLVPEEVIAADCLVPLPSDEIPFFAGALCEPFSCVISAQDRHLHISQETPLSPRVPRLGLLEGGVTMIIGAGPMGKMHAEAALRFSPSHVIVVDLIEERLEWVREVLAAPAQKAGTELHAVTPDASQELLREAGGGKGADDIIVAVGNRGVQIAAQQWLAKGGVLNLFGGLKRGEHVIDVDSLRVHYDEIRLAGSSGGAPADVAEALRMTADGEFDPGLHMSMVGSLEMFPRALEMVRNAETDGKIVLYPQVRHTDLIPTRHWGRAEELAFLKQHARGGS